MKKIYGVSEARWNQMMEHYNNDKETVKEIIDEWGKQAVDRGWDIFDYDGTGLLEIECIGDVMAFDSDDDAVLAAIDAGIKIIPIEELPENFDRRYFGWIDTPENRKAIEDYCKEQMNV